MYFADADKLLRGVMERRVLNDEELAHLGSRLGLSIDELIAEGVLTRGITGEVIIANAVEFVLRLAERGVDVEALSEYIDWNEFEDFVSKAFETSGMIVLRDVKSTRIKKFQIDAIAIDTKLSLALVLECKHWRTGITKRLNDVVREHIARLNKLNSSCEWFVSEYPELRRVKHFIPVVVTLKNVETRIVDGVPIVPVYVLRNFIADLDRYVDELNLMKIRNRCFTGFSQD